MDTSNPTTWALILSCGALSAGGVVHWFLDRVSKRLPRWVVRRQGPRPTVATIESYEHLIALSLIPLRLASWIFVLLFVADQFPELRSFREMILHLGSMTLMGPLFEINGHSYSVSDLLELPFVVGAVWLFVTGLIHLFRTQVLSYTGLSRGVQESVATLIRYALTLTGSILVLQSWGVDVRSLALAFSVLGVGIGFGLQNIANNFVSGLVINFERPIQPGDFVRIGEWTGTVEHIGGRSTLVRTLDHVSILVPNSRLLESEVVNWSHGDPLSRLHVGVGVAYGSDLRRVRATLLEVARKHPDVESDPKPRVELRQFGASSLDFELLVWTRDPRSQSRLMSDLNLRIAVALRAAGIEIPFSQHDLHLRSPAVDGLLEAWGRKSLGMDAIPPSPAARTSLDDDPLTDILGPAEWSHEQLEAVARRMRGPGGVEILDRRHLFKVYHRCFVGREAVDWLMRNEDLGRGEAVLLGQILERHNLLHHVLDEHGFEDGNFFYRFRGDEGGESMESTGLRDEPLMRR